MLDGCGPLGDDRLDLEAGTLRDWTAEGNAFGGQPGEGDAVATRRNDMPSRHQGRFWIGTYERGDVEFRATNDLAGDGCWAAGAYHRTLMQGSGEDRPCFNESIGRDKSKARIVRGAVRASLT